MERSDVIRPASACDQLFEQLADEYEHEYQIGKQPDLDAYMGRLPAECDSVRDELFNVLLLTDACYLKGRLGGREPSKQDLIQLYPHLADAIARTAIARDLDDGRSLDWRLGKFRVEGKISEGRQGHVLKAYDLTLARPVALKLAHPSAPENWIEREGRALARLQHPNILRVLELSQWDGKPMLVTEYVDGSTLVERFNVATPSESEVLSIAIQLSDALRCLHDHGLSHRDLQPSNILINAQGMVKVIDFGLAISMDRMSNSTGQVQEFHGTPLFMAPEQVRCDGTSDPRKSDLFSLGATLLLLMTKMVPVKGSNGKEIFDNLSAGRLNQDAIQLCKTRFPLVAPVCTRLLAPNAHERLADAQTAWREFKAAEQKLNSANASFSPLFVPSYRKVIAVPHMHADQWENYFWYASGPSPSKLPLFRVSVKVGQSVKADEPIYSCEACNIHVRSPVNGKVLSTCHRVNMVDPLGTLHMMILPDEQPYYADARLIFKDLLLYAEWIESQISWEKRLTRRDRIWHWFKGVQPEAPPRGFNSNVRLSLAESRRKDPEKFLEALYRFTQMPLREVNGFDPYTT